MEIKIGLNTMKLADGDVESHRIEINGEVFHKISNYDLMRPFFMSIVSDSDHWMFISSNGGLTAGRRNSNAALFPYYTDDQITDTAEVTGSKTIIIAGVNNEQFLWEPFSAAYNGIYAVRRNLYKSIYSDVILFEEINEDLRIKFQYAWYHSEKFGFVRQAEICNLSASPIQLKLIDGIQNILPSGVTQQLQLQRSNLVNAYKKNELLAENGIAVYSLSAQIVDRPEPSESLRANMAWSVGFEGSGKLISALQLDDFRKGRVVHEESDVRAERGAYFVSGGFSLDGEMKKDWIIVADVNKSASDVAYFSDLIANGSDLKEIIWADIRDGRTKLKDIINSADGLQASNDRLSSARHASNVLFNVMRGGVFVDGYTIGKPDLKAFIGACNHALPEKLKTFFEKLPTTLSLQDLLRDANNAGDGDLIRLCYEYLPLYFSRRHGDPSRPWNAFSIETKSADGSKILNYEGNWRDIFQNWEALATAYPGFVESMIAKFLNATTVDGYNPYRITRSGIDWEVIEPHDPWSFIGYWGDHQIIYLLKLLETSDRYHPGQLQRMFNDRVFSFANVPYRIKDLEALVKDPHDTITYNAALAELIEQRVKDTGSDGKLVWNRSGEVLRASLIEKLLIPLLAKLSNFIPEGGVWLNTQRPEWNDANNALVGNGVSMVTLYYMRRYVSFLSDHLTPPSGTEFSISAEVKEWQEELSTVFSQNKHLLTGRIHDRDRNEIVRDLGMAAQRYNQKVYKGHAGELKTLHCDLLLKFLHDTLAFIDHTISINRRDDHLYHAYNLVSFDQGNCTVKHLYEMLEGQVAVLSAAHLSGAEGVSILDAMKKSKLFRADQYSYLLYPDRILPRFTDKNIIPDSLVNSSRLFKIMLKDNNTSVIEKDVSGKYHFNADIRNAGDVKKRLHSLTQLEYRQLVQEESEMILAAYEAVFNHKQFTGRSGTFFGYEGLNSIYWHMVSKLLLAVQENIYWSIDRGDDRKIINKLIEHYFEIRAGIGLNKSPGLYGAFPTDPYSHTPGNKGAQQPGMTGQVKEDILCRFGELGVRVRDGKITFREYLLRKSEFLDSAEVFEFKNNAGDTMVIDIPHSSLCYTLCQIPVIYSVADGKRQIQIVYESGASENIEGLEIDASISAMIFGRDTSIKQIHVSLTPQLV